MAVSKLYLTASTPIYTPPTIRGGWEDTTGGVVGELSPTKTRGGVIRTVTQAELTASADYDVLLYRGVSMPLAAQTISGTVDVVIGVDENSPTADACWYAHLYVTQGNSDTPRGTILADYAETAANEWPTTAAGRGFASAQTLSSLAISAGDRLVAELGWRAKNTSTFSMAGILYYGTLTDPEQAVAPDLTVSSTNVEREAGFLQFSVPLDELVVESLVYQSGAHTLQAPVTESRIYQLGIQTVQPIQVVDTANVRIYQLGIQTVQPEPLYLDGPPDPGEDPCIQTSFQAWLELDL